MDRTRVGLHAPNEDVYVDQWLQPGLQHSVPPPGAVILCRDG